MLLSQGHSDIHAHTCSTESELSSNTFQFVSDQIKVSVGYIGFIKYASVIVKSLLELDVF